MILGHYYYATLLCKIKSEVDNKGNMYQRNQLEGMPNKVIDCDIVLPKDPGEDADKEEKYQYRKECNEAYGKFYPLALEKIETFVAK